MQLSNGRNGATILYLCIPNPPINCAPKCFQWCFGKKKPCRALLFRKPVNVLWDTKSGTKYKKH